MIRTVELARGIAALLVVIFHANAAAKEFDGPAFAWLGFAEHGVDFFNKDHDEKVKDLLNSPDYEYLRCIPGKI